MSILTNSNQFTNYTPQEFSAINTVCNISSTGFAEYCPRECPQVFLDYTNDQGEIVNGEFENSFNIYAGVCHISENVPERNIVDSYMYDTETYQRVGFGSMCPLGYTYFGVQACKPDVQVTPLPIIIQGQKVEPVQQTVQPMDAPVPPALIRSGGAEAVGSALMFLCLGIIVGMVWDSLTKPKN